ncbi:MAG: type II secretion system protein [Luteolibacter sp.]
MNPKVIANSSFYETRPRQNSQRPDPGFTLIEILVVITIIAVLAAGLFPVVSHLRRSASSAVCVSKMSQIGSALLIYTQDHGGRLPTSDTDNTLFTGQGPWYNRDHRRLQNHIGDYLGAPVSDTWSTQATVMTYDPSFAWPALLAEGKLGSASVVLSSSVSLLVGGVESTGFAWSGSKPSGTGSYVGRRLDEIIKTASQQVFIEVDQKNTNAGWKDATPPGPIHGSYRNALYFDWHVGRVNVKP